VVVTTLDYIPSRATLEQEQGRLVASMEIVALKNAAAGDAHTDRG
jgi:hypothetical protein